MHARLTTHTPERESRDRLRFNTAAILHATTHGATKMVAAEFDCSDKRIYAQTEGRVANRLELLCVWLDRVVIEKGVDAVASVLAFLSARYSSRNARPRSSVSEALAAAAIEGGEAQAALLRAWPDGISPFERPHVLTELHQWKDRIDALIAAVETEPQPKTADR